MIALEIRSLPIEPLRQALVDLGARVEADGSVVGQDWSARFVRLPPARVGSLQIAAFRVEIDGSNAAAAAGVVRSLTTRGGG